MCYSILTADSNWDIAVARPRQNSSTLPLLFAFATLSNTVARLRSSGITLCQAFHIQCTGYKTSCAPKSTTLFQGFTSFRFTQTHNRSWVSIYIYIHISYVLREVLTPGDRVRIWRTPSTFSRQQCPRNDECWHTLSRSWALLLIDVMYAVATLFFRETAGEDLLSWYTPDTPSNMPHATLPDMLHATHMQTWQDT